MIRLLKTIIFAWALFIAVSIIGGGGDLFRGISDKGGVVSQKVVEWVAGKADRYKDDADSIKQFVKELAGEKKKMARDI
ncbi:MAG TPA: hypothetical protein DHV16_04575 [Nitrospiraceae bacterium]|nr:MAG: hypothetical protein A2Z82_00080 [Nitrospirae bacterium GWA2_46_11]OGW23472.1 MAG: hypothetical protein A2X55_11230 [Nitrospirae bacterium GWB2_47_37]HAK88003.1 hypothetical protein [Nitrospiraceae bacterium]HCZ11524.1 hypothetical protein [Nitrospiraceae bacterium]